MRNCYDKSIFHRKMFGERMQTAPLSEQLRPKSLSEIVGQDHLIGKDGWIFQTIAAKRPLSLLLYGPPGCGKTTIARIYAASFGLPVHTLSAVLGSSAELKKILRQTEQTPLFSRQTILFVDELHRFNRAQQDIFLPFLEDGSMILIGATTENPSFAFNGALLSRLRVFALTPLDDRSLQCILDRYEKTIGSFALSEEAKRMLILQAQGDGRHLLNLLENLEQLRPNLPSDAASLANLLPKKMAYYDKDRDGHYQFISALHKSVRGSDPDAALYWLARMLEGGEDPHFLGRRLIRMAVEDIGLADPHALGIALHADAAYGRLGSPEGDLALAEAVLYLALAPKSNATYTAHAEARKQACQTGHLPPPKHICNAPTELMKEFGYGKGYIYDPDTKDGFSGQNYFPEEMSRPSFYRPVSLGFERELQKRLNYFNKLRAAKTGSSLP